MLQNGSGTVALERARELSSALEKYRTAETHAEIELVFQAAERTAENLVFRAAF